MQFLKVLVVEDDPGTLLVLQDRLDRAGHEVRTATDGVEAVKLISEQFFDVIITDLVMPGDVDGIGVLEKAQEKSKPTEVIVMSAYTSVESAVEAMKKGAVDYLQKPVNLDELKFRLDRISTMKSVVKDASNLREAMDITEKSASQTIQDLEMMVSGLRKTCSAIKKTLTDQGLEPDERLKLALDILPPDA